MIFKKRAADSLPNWGPVTDVAWDDETVKRIADSERLSVRLTHISKTVSLGKTRVGDDARHTSEWSISGVMTRPKFVPVNIAFDNQGDEFGGFFYGRRDNQDFGGRKVSLPFLEVWLSDRDEQKAQLFHSTLSDAIMCGQQCADVRFWKEKGKGLMTQLDQQHGYSYESRYPILGMVIWPTLQVARLPKWAVPTDQIDFSLDALPKHRSASWTKVLIYWHDSVLVR
jgi:hypothetical protein